MLLFYSTVLPQKHLREEISNSEKVRKITRSYDVETMTATHLKLSIATVMSKEDVVCVTVRMLSLSSFNSFSQNNRVMILCFLTPWQAVTDTN